MTGVERIMKQLQDDQDKVDAAELVADILMWPSQHPEIKHTLVTALISLPLGRIQTLTEDILSDLPDLDEPYCA